MAGRVIFLSIAHFIHDVYSAFLSPLLPLLIQKHGLSLAQAGFLGTIVQVPALMNPWIGMLADRLSLRIFVIAAPMLTAVPMSLLGLAPGYGMLILLLLITGISTAFFHVPAPVMVARLSGDKKGRGMSFFMTGGETARTVGPVIAVAAVSYFGLEGMYPVMTVGIVASVWIHFRFKDVSITSAKGTPPATLGRAYKEIKHVLVPLTGILAARGMMHAATVTFLPTFLAAQTNSLWMGGAGLAIFEASGVAGVLAAGSLSDRFGRRTVLFVSLSLAPLAVAGVALFTGPLRFAALVVGGFSLLSTTPVMLALVQEHATHHPAAANGLFMMISFITRSGIVFLVGLLGDFVGLKNTYLVCAALGMGGLLFLRAIPDRLESD